MYSTWMVHVQYMDGTYVANKPNGMSGTRAALCLKQMGLAADGCCPATEQHQSMCHTGAPLVLPCRLMPYPPELLQLIAPGLHGAIFLPSVGSCSLASSLAGESNPAGALIWLRVLCAAQCHNSASNLPACCTWCSAQAALE
jgi:hypothetical protein